MASTYDNLKIIVVDNASSKDDFYALKIHIDEICTANDLQENKLILLSNAANRGFAAGVNTGIKYAIESCDCKYIWILNNDTIVDKNACELAIDYLRNNPNYGLTSMQIRSYFNQDHIQFDNHMKYNNIIGDIEKIKMPLSDKVYSGSSFLMTRTCFEAIGYMEEIFFLYREEQDWIEKMKAKNIQYGYCEKSVVYHRGSATIKASGSRLSWFCFIRSTLILARKYHPYCLPSIYLYWMAMGIYKIIRKDIIAYKMIWKELIMYPIKGEKYHNNLF